MRLAVVPLLALLLVGAPLAGAIVRPPAAPSLVAFERIGPAFSHPLLVTHAGDGSGRVFVVEQAGLVKVLSSPSATTATTWLDLTTKVTPGGPGERGLLGLAFDPAYATNGRVFASYTDPAGNSVIERYTVPAPATGAPDPASATTILTVTQPFANHNGGNLAFGPDGDLYIGFGDGGGQGDPYGNAQDPGSLLGKLLRLDVRGATYAIPSDNPFVATPGARGEIDALGLRNPWRFSFDPITGDLWIGDVGASRQEEIDLRTANLQHGENFGWNQFEGNLVARNGADSTGKTFPVLTYDHGPHCSVTGGVVDRSTRIPALVGAYLYGDFCSGFIWMARGAGTQAQSVVLVQSPFNISSFGVDDAGDVYVMNHSNGGVYRIVPPV